MSRRVSLTISAIVVLGAGLRLWTVSDGLPYNPTVDEPEVIDRSVAMMKTGDFNPHFFDYPGFVFYLHLAVAMARFIYGAIGREWASLADVWPGDFYLWGRVATALIGTLTIYVVYRAALRWGTTVALVAAAVMAVQPQHLRESQLALTDTPLTFFVALTLLLSLHAAERGHWRWFVLAGLGAGLAGATKYNGGLALLMPLSAAWALPSFGQRAAAAGAAMAAAVVGMIAGAPYTVLDLPGFLNGFAALANHYIRAESLFEGIVQYLKYVRVWFSWPADPDMPRWLLTSAQLVAPIPALLCCLIGVVILLAQLGSRRRTAVLTLLVFAFAYLWLIADQSMRIGRYAMPLLPAICISFAVGLVGVRDVLIRPSASTVRRRVVLALLPLVLLPTAMQAALFNHHRSKVWTGQQAAEWILANVQPDQRVVIEAMAVRLPPPFRSVHLARLIERPVDAYAKDGATYLVSSSTETDKYFRDPTRFGHQIVAFNAMLRSTEIVKVFSGNDEHPGPTIRILKVRK